MHEKVKQKGVALAVLLWFIAALSLLVAGIVLTAKVDIRYAQLQTSMAKVAASGDGATLLYLDDMISGRLTADQQLDALNDEKLPLAPATYEVGPYRVFIRAIPSNGLINILGADEELLVDLLSIAGGLERPDAEKLTQSVLQWRIPPERDKERSAQVLEPVARVLEDIMKVPGMTRNIFEKISRLVYINVGLGQADIDVSVAPMEVLMVLAEGDQSQAEELRASSQVNPVSPSGLVRIDARIDAGFGTVYQRSAWVDLGGGLTKGFGRGVATQKWEIKRKNTVMAVPSIDFNELNYVSR